MTYRRQELPFAVQVELVEGCPLRCSFCGLNGIRGKANDYKFMEPETLKSLFNQMHKLKWNPRVEFAVHGEPSQHPDFIGMIRQAKMYAPRLQLMMTSNGAGFMRRPGARQNVLDLFEAGLDVLALDDYEGVNFVDKIRTETRGLESEFETFEYPDDPRGSPHARRKIKALIFIQAIDTATKGNHSLLNNHAGAGAPLVGPEHKSQTRRCAKPFRELTVRWDGTVAVCCNDWRGAYKCGSVVRDGLEKVWNGDSMNAARQKLYHGQRDFGPCKGCDAISYRTGLLPDKMGQETMSPPDKRTDAAIARAMSGKPYTAPVKREWEK